MNRKLIVVWSILGLVVGWLLVWWAVASNGGIVGVFKATIWGTPKSELASVPRPAPQAAPVAPAPQPAPTPSYQQRITSVPNPTPQQREMQDGEVYPCDQVTGDYVAGSRFTCTWYHTKR